MQRTTQKFTNTRVRIFTQARILILNRKKRNETERGKIKREDRNRGREYEMVKRGSRKDPPSRIQNS